MAIDPSTEYPGQIETPDAGHPYGGAKNETSPGTFDGTPFEKAMLDDQFGFFQALLFLASIVPSGTADDATDKNSAQYLQSILHMIMSADVFVESGAADVYVLTAGGLNTAPADYHDNMILSAVFINANTGASTADLEGLGVKNIFLNGVALTGGEILANARVVLQYDLGNDRFNMIQPDIMSKLTVTGVAASPPDANTIVKENIIKGWINFDGTGAISVRDSYNVSSIVDNGVGNYDINWDRDFANTNYCCALGSGAPDIVGDIISVGTFRVDTTVDSALIMVQAMGDQ